MKALILAPVRRAAASSATLALAILLSSTARPVFADSKRVIAVPELHALTPEAPDDAVRITAELRRRFQALPSLRVVEGPPGLTAAPGHPDPLLPDFVPWRDAHVDIVLVGNTSVLNDGRHKVSLFIWGVDKRTQLVGQQFVFSAHQGHEHEIADLVRDALAAALLRDAASAQP